MVNRISKLIELNELNLNEITAANKTRDSLITKYFELI